MIRAFRREDTEAIIALWEHCGLIRRANDPVRDIERKLASSTGPLLIAEVDDRVVGSAMVGWNGLRGWVNYLAVEPDLQGQGIGRELMEAAEASLTEVGCPKINVQVRTGNDAVDFYRHLGFTEDEVVSMGKRLDEDDIEEREGTCC